MHATLTKPPTPLPTPLPPTPRPAAQCSGNQWWRVAFYPTALARVYFFNRMDGGNNQRVIGGGATVTVNAQTGTQLFTAGLTAAAINEFTLAPWGAVTTPAADAEDQTSPEGRNLRVRYVRVSAPVGEP